MEYHEEIGEELAAKPMVIQTEPGCCSRPREIGDPATVDTAELIEAAFAKLSSGFGTAVGYGCRFMLFLATAHAAVKGGDDVGRTLTC